MTKDKQEDTIDELDGILYFVHTHAVAGHDSIPTINEARARLQRYTERREAALESHERTMGHRMEAYIGWTGYIRFCSKYGTRVNIQYAYGLYRRYNDLTDTAKQELIALGKVEQALKLAYYDFNFTDGSVSTERYGEDFEMAAYEAQRQSLEDKAA